MGEGILGIDIGGSGIKGNLVDPADGSLLSDRYKVETPRPSTPDAVAGIIVEMVEHFGVRGAVGCTFPAIVKSGVVLSAANVDDTWMDTDADALFEQVTGCRFRMVNDADAAGVAEMTFGAGRDRNGVVMVLTFGTGIGSGLFHDGVLVPNSELGHLELDGHAPVEHWAAANQKQAENLSWKAWGRRVNEYLDHLNRLFSPDLFILGGGVSRKWSKYADWITVGVETVPAFLQNEAGIVGAAMFAQQDERHTS